MNQTIKGCFVDPNTKESIPILEVKNIEYTLAPESENNKITNPIRDVLLMSKGKLRL